MVPDVVPPRGMSLKSLEKTNGCVSTSSKIPSPSESPPTVKVKVAVAECDSDPLVPVMVTVKLVVVAGFAVQVRVAVAGDGGRVTLLGLIAPQVKPTGTVSVKATVPAKPLTAVTVIVEVRLLPAGPEGEVAAIAKSTKVNVAVVS